MKIKIVYSSWGLLLKYVILMFIFSSHNISLEDLVSETFKK
jgi:hypothetical protein